MKPSLSVACSLLSLMVRADASPTVGTPVLEGTTVTCLNKQLEYLPQQGAIRLTADGETLLSSSVCFHETDRRTGRDLWLVNAGKGLSHWRVVTNRVGNAFHFDAYRRLPECEWRHFHVEFELMPDGLVRLTEQGWPCPSNTLYDVTWNSHFLEAPTGVGANSAVDDRTPYVCRKNPKGRIVGQLNDGAHAGKSYYNDPAALPAVLLWD